MSATRISVGIYISSQDLDIADFFNSLAKQGESPVRWISALLILNQEGKAAALAPSSNRFPSPLLSTHKEASKNPPQTTPSLLFGGGGEVAVGGVRKSGWDYGWQKRGEHGEIVVGSVVNLPIRSAEVIGIIQSLKQNNIKVSTYVKGLLHSAFQPQPGAVPMDAKVVSHVLKTHLYHTPKASMSLPYTPSNVPTPVVQELDSDAAIQFDTPAPIANTSKNPLLSYID